MTDGDSPPAQSRNTERSLQQHGGNGLFRLPLQSEITLPFKNTVLSLSLSPLSRWFISGDLPDEKKSPTTSVLKPNITESCTASKSPQKRHLLHQNTAVLHPNALSSNETTRLHWRPAAPPSGSADGRAGTARVGGLRAQRSLLLIDGLLEVLKVVVGGGFARSHGWLRRVMVSRNARIQSLKASDSPKPSDAHERKKNDQQ